MSVARVRLAVMGLLAAVSIVVFAGPIQGELVWDDVTLIANNPYLRAPDALARAFTGDFWKGNAEWSRDQPSNHRMYRPLVSAAYVIEHRLWGDRPVGFHAVNLFLHAVCVLLVFRWLTRRLSDVGVDPTVPAALGALVFALHPSRAESVAWISGCTDLWMTLFILIGLECWDRGRGLLATVATAAAFILAMLCKEVAVVAPLVLLVDGWLRRTGSARRAGIVAAVLVLALSLRVWLVPIHAERALSGNITDLVTRTVATLGGFIRIAVWPWPASTQVGYLASATTGAAPIYPTSSFAIGTLTLALLTGLIVVSVRRPVVRPWLADLAWFLLFLVPVLNIIPLSSIYYLSERYLYPAGLGLAAIATRSSLLLMRLPLRARPFGLLAGMTLLAAYAVGSAKHAGHFASADALWTYEWQRDPQNLAVLSNLMDVRQGEQRWEEAEALALEWMRTMPAAEDKANAYGHWLSIELQRAEHTDDARLAAVARIYEQIAAGENAGGVYAEVPEAGRAWLRRSRGFRSARAEAALAAGNYDLARRLYESFARDPAAREGTRRSLIITQAAQGDLTAAESRLDEAMQAGMSVDAPRLSGLLKALREVQAHPELPPEAVAIAQAKAFTEIVPEPAIARHLLREAVMRSPGSVDLRLALLSLDLLTQRFADARATVDELRRVRPGEDDRWNRVMQDVRDAEASVSEKGP